jgi:hypothetical protein
VSERVSVCVCVCVCLCVSERVGGYLCLQLTLFVLGMCLRVTTASESEKKDTGIKKESIKMMKMERGKEKDKGERR